MDISGTQCQGKRQTAASLLTSMIERKQTEIQRLKSLREILAVDLPSELDELLWQLLITYNKR